jgi:hypothetical protein
MSRYLLFVLALVGWVALALQWHIVLEAAAQKGQPTWMALGNFLSYFTILTNGFIAFTLSISSLAAGSALAGVFNRPSVQASLAGCIIMVSLIYHVALAKAWNPQGLQWWTNFLLHDALPFLFVAHWFLFVPKGTLGWFHPLLWMIYPLIYLGFMLARGAWTGFYPYPFVDVTWHGYHRVFLNLGALVVAFVGTFYAIVVVDKWRGKRV